MNKFIYILAFAAFVGCSSNHNELMTKLVNEKKTLDDSLISAKYYEIAFKDSARQTMRNSPDTSAWKVLADSSNYYFGIGLQVKDEIERVNFSIDSLSKMK